VAPGDCSPSLKVVSKMRTVSIWPPEKKNRSEKNKKTPQIAEAIAGFAGSGKLSNPTIRAWLRPRPRRVGPKQREVEGHARSYVGKVNRLKRGGSQAGNVSDE